MDNNKERPIFLFAPCQRCGSTMIQRFLNSSSEIFIWGEHDGYLNLLYTGFNKFSNWNITFRDQRQMYFEMGFNTWTACLAPDNPALHNATINYIIELFRRSPEGKCISRWGFKEVRYNSSVAKWLLTMFPQAKILFINRHIASCLTSLLRWEIARDNNWSRTNTLESLESWIRINNSFLSVVDTYGSICTFKYEDIISDKKKFVSEVSSFLEVSETIFNTDVLDDIIYEPNSDSRNRSNIYISENEMNLIQNKEVDAILEAYGY